MAASTRSIVLIVIGVVLLAVSLLADAFGIGAHPGLGWKQLVGAAVGVVVAVIGIVGRGKQP